MDLKTMTVEQKKVLAYDLIALAEQTQNNLRVVNASIAEDNKPNARTPDVVPPVLPVVKEEKAKDGAK